MNCTSQYSRMMIHRIWMKAQGKNYHARYYRIFCSHGTHVPMWGQNSTHTYCQAGGHQHCLTRLPIHRLVQDVQASLYPCGNPNLMKALILLCDRYELKFLYFPQQTLRNKTFGDAGEMKNCDRPCMETDQHHQNSCNGYNSNRDTSHRPRSSLSYSQNAWITNKSGKVFTCSNRNFSSTVAKSSSLKNQNDIISKRILFYSTFPQTQSSNTLLQNNCSSLSMFNIRHYRKYSKVIDVSEDPAVDLPTVRRFLQEHNMRVDQGYTCLITTCPKPGIQRDKMSDTNSIFINMTTGFFQCKHCKRSGHWGALEDNIRVLTAQKRKKDFDCLKGVGEEYPLPSESAPFSESLKAAKLLEDVTRDEFHNIENMFKLQCLKQETLSHYGVKFDPSSHSLLLPILSPDKILVGVKKLTAYVSEEGLLKSVREQNIPRSGRMELFGWSQGSEGTGDLILTTTEMDAMIVHQELGAASLALPRGYSILPQELLPSLEKFKKIVLWFGSDVRAWEAAKQLAKKLNEKRCFVIRPSIGAPSPLLALQQKLSLKRILSNARAMTHQSIVSFPQLRQEVFSELSHIEQVAGIKWKRYPTLNKLLKGHRRGELTVFTGPTGSGKTTFISDYSLDLCMQGANTLWGSFEINNVRLAKTMLTQFAQCNLSKKLNEFDHWADKFEQLPMYFMTFFGQENIKKVIETMSHAVYVNDIAHVVVDNLQFMMGIHSEKVDRFYKQDTIIAAFRKFATSMNCHVTLVIHPRKEKDADDLTTASIFGSAKASQEADNVLILQDKRLLTSRGRKYIQVTKNRFDGELGIMLLKFDRDTLSFIIKDTKDKTKREDADKSKHGQIESEQKNDAVQS